MAQAGQPIEKIFVSIEADIDKLLKETAEGVEDVKRELNEIKPAVDDVEEGFEDTAEAVQTTVSRTQRLRDFAVRAAKALVAFAGAVAAAFKISAEAVQGLRVELGFRLMAAQADESSEEIIAAMRRASLGVIDDLELMRQTNAAMLLGVAKTPAEFEKLTEAAITLGRATGRDATESLNRLINAAGRGSLEVLDELGISIAEVNTEMERLARQEFGVAVTQLDIAQRSVLRMQAVLTVAAEKAAQLGGISEDIGTSAEQAGAKFKNLRQEVGEIVTVILNISGGLSDGVDLLDRLVAGARAWQRVLLQIAAILQAIRITFNKISNLQITSIEDLKTTFTEAFQTEFSDLEQRFLQIVEPERFAEEIAAGIGDTSPLDPIADAMEEDALDIESLLDDLGTSMIDATRDRQERLEELEITHGEKLASIATRYHERLADLDRRFEERRADIAEKGEERLADLARETAQKRTDLEAEFEQEQIRSREDFNRDMMRLNFRFLDSLVDAVKNRDARAIVDLMRQHKRETRERTDDFDTKQKREKEDQQLRLRELSRNEARRRREIQDSLARQLRDLQQNHQRQLSEAAQAQARRVAQENASFARRQADLERALARRLATVARELADEEKLNRAGAQRILLALNKSFGVGGDIDKLMLAFAARRRQRMVVEVTFERPRILRPPGAPSAPEELGGFARGGTVVARRPSMALFGEGGPEMATFTPLNQVGGMAGERRMRIDLNLSGSAPPGVRSADRDAIAGVLLSALQDAGWLR